MSLLRKGIKQEFKRGMLNMNERLKERPTEYQKLLSGSQGQGHTRTDLLSQKDVYNF